MNKIKIKKSQEIFKVSNYSRYSFKSDAQWKWGNCAAGQWLMWSSKWESISMFLLKTKLVLSMMFHGLAPSISATAWNIQYSYDRESAIGDGCTNDNLIEIILNRLVCFCSPRKRNEDWSLNIADRCSKFHNDLRGKDHHLSCVWKYSKCLRCAACNSKQMMVNPRGVNSFTFQEIHWEWVVYL